MEQQPWSRKHSHMQGMNQISETRDAISQTGIQRVASQLVLLLELRVVTHTTGEQGNNATELGTRILHY